MKLPKLIVFDMDGVLIDVSRSYREAVRKTARLFLQGAKGGEKLPDPLFPLDDLARLKQTGGLNNDWDLAAQSISLLFTLVVVPEYAAHPDHFSRFEKTIMGCDVSRLADFLSSSTTPLMDLLEKYGKHREPFISACFQGDVGAGNIIKQIFQEIYLGQSLFRSIYRIGTRFFRGEGLISQERPLIAKDILAELAGNNLLAIATGRPRVEADYPLDHFNIRQYFSLMVTLDDCTREEEMNFRERRERISLSKPNPYMLDLIPQLLDTKFGECYYLGDMPDDMLAAASSRTGYRGIGIILSSLDRERRRKELLQAGAACIIEDFSVLPEMLACETLPVKS